MAVYHTLNGRCYDYLYSLTTSLSFPLSLSDLSLSRHAANYVYYNNEYISPARELCEAHNAERERETDAEEI